MTSVPVRNPDFDAVVSVSPIVCPANPAKRNYPENTSPKKCRRRNPVYAFPEEQVMTAEAIQKRNAINAMGDTSESPDFTTVNVPPR